GAAISAFWPAVLGAYVPLGSLANAASLLDRTWPQAVDDVLTQQIREPLLEQAELQSIPHLTPIEDDLTPLVQQKYEENPSPRWVNTAAPGRPATLDAFLRRQLPWATPESL